MSDDYSYPIDIDSIRRAFPPGTEVPPLLIDFAGWLKGRDWGNAGCYELVGDFSDNAPIVDGSPLRDQFALFARLPEGSVVGAWYGAGTSAANAPIVVLGSEGQYEIIAASLEGLLAKIAIQRFEEDVAWTDFTPHEDAEDETDELADWLVKRLARERPEEFDRAADGTAGLRPLDGEMVQGSRGVLGDASGDGRARRTAGCAPASGQEAMGPHAFRGRDRGPAISGARAGPRPPADRRSRRD